MPNYTLAGRHPGQADSHICFKVFARLLCTFHRIRQWSLINSHISPQIPQHVVRRAADCSGSGEYTEIPILRSVTRLSMSWCKVGPHLVGERGSTHLHPQWTKNPRIH